MSVRVGFVRLTCDDPKLRLTVRLGPEPVRITGGVGGWEVSARPRQVGMTTWAGVEPLQVELSLMFDGWGGKRSQDAKLRQLLTVARGDDESPPGVLELEGVPLPVDRWVIEALDYGDAIISSGVEGAEYGRPVPPMETLRQQVSVTLREYVPPEYLQLRKRALQGSKGKTRVVTAKQGDTPAKIARREHCAWTNLRDLNPTLVRKANQALKRGVQLRVPVAVSKTRRAKGATHRKSPSRSNR
jgi:hypothetical protein